MIRLAVEAIVETSGYNMVGLILLNGDILEVQPCPGYDEIGRSRHIPIAIGVNGGDKHQAGIYLLSIFW